MANTGPPLPFVREMANEVLALFRDSKARERAAASIDDLSAQNRASRDKCAKRNPKSRVIDDDRGTVRVEYLKRGKVIATGPTFRKGWPFPIQHGIDEPPGCVLVAVLLNNYACEAPDFDPTHRWIGPENPPFLLSAVEKLEPGNESTLRRVIAAAKEHLQPQAKAKRGRKKADYDTVQAEAKLAEEWKRASERGIRKADFAKDKGMTLNEFDNLLARVRGRKRSSSK